MVIAQGIKSLGILPNIPSAGRTPPPTFYDLSRTKATLVVLLIIRPTTSYTSIW
jgi:hypothetical protein